MGWSYFETVLNDWGLIVVIVYYFQIWSKKEHNIIISRVINSHMGPMYIEIPYIFNLYNSIYYQLFVSTVKWFQVLPCNTNNSMKHQSFVYTQLKGQTVLFDS